MLLYFNLFEIVNPGLLEIFQWSIEHVFISKLKRACRAGLNALDFNLNYATGHHFPSGVRVTVDVCACVRAND